MARDFISINITAPQAIALKSYITTLRTAEELGQRCLDLMNHMNDGTNFTDIETNFGLPAGKGQTIFNFVNGSVGSFKGTFQVADATTITQQVG